MLRSISKDFSSGQGLRPAAKNGKTMTTQQRILAFLLCISIYTVQSNAQTPAAKPMGQRPPNFLVILLDDLGWRDVGFMGNDFVETPTLDQLAKRAVCFDQAYASAPNCAPTRACLMSGQYTPRHGIYTVVDPRQPNGSPWHKLMGAESKTDLDPGIETIAEALGAGGYATSFYGMWNLGRGRRGPITPEGQGFQEVVFPESLSFMKDEYFDEQGNYLSDRLTDEVLKFVDKNQQQPFFIYYADHAVHAPFNPKRELLEKYQRKLTTAGDDRRNDPAYAATIEAVDQNIGRMLKRLAELKLMENTYVIFMSDNGGTSQYNAPLRGGKGELYEGGIRVPLLVAGPGIKKPGTRNDTPVASIDIYPTLLELASLKKATTGPLHGQSLKPLVTGQGKFADRPLFWHFPCYVGKATPSSAIRQGDFKLLQFFEDGGRFELYNLRSDPSEKNDLSKSLPEQTATLKKQLLAWQSELGAAIPTEANPNFDPRAVRQGGGGPNGPGGGKGPGGNAAGGKSTGGKGPGNKGPGGMNQGQGGKQGQSENRGPGNPNGPNRSANTQQK